MRLIDANALKDVLLDLDVKSDDLKWKCAIEEAIQKIFPKIIDDQPTIKVEDSVQKKKETGFITRTLIIIFLISVASVNTFQM